MFSVIFYCVCSLKQQSVGRHVAPLGNIILISSQTVLDELSRPTITPTMRSRLFETALINCTDILSVSGTHQHIDVTDQPWSL